MSLSLLSAVFFLVEQHSGVVLALRDLVVDSRDRGGPLSPPFMEIDGGGNLRASATIDSFDDDLVGVDSPPVAASAYSAAGEEVEEEVEELGAARSSADGGNFRRPTPQKPSSLLLENNESRSSGQKSGDSGDPYRKQLHTRCKHPVRLLGPLNLAQCKKKCENWGGDEREPPPAPRPSHVYPTTNPRNEPPEPPAPSHDEKPTTSITTTTPTTTTTTTTTTATQKWCRLYGRYSNGGKTKVYRGGKDVGGREVGRRVEVVITRLFTVQYVSVQEDPAFFE